MDSRETVEVKNLQLMGIDATYWIDNMTLEQDLTVSVRDLRSVQELCLPVQNQALGHRTKVQILML